MLAESLLIEQAGGSYTSAAGNSLILFVNGYSAPPPFMIVGYGALS